MHNRTQDVGKKISYICFLYFLTKIFLGSVWSFKYAYQKKVFLMKARQSSSYTSFFKYYSKVSS